MNKSGKKKFAQRMKKNPTPYEAMMHNALLIAFEPWDVKIRVQEVVGPYIADFFIHPERLVVEVDGRGHDEVKQAAYDGRRATYMRNLGIYTHRVTNHDVWKDAAKCAMDVVKLCQTLRPKPAKGGVKVTICPPGASAHIKGRKFIRVKGTSYRIKKRW